MFDFFRKFNKAFMVLLFLLIVPSFAMFGVSQYNQVASTGEVVASVGGNDITRPEWDAQHRIESDRARQQNPNVDPTLLDTDTARYASLEMLVRERLLTTATAKSKLAVSDAELARVFSADASLAGFRDEKGGFDRARFVAATGRTPDQYEALVRAYEALGGPFEAPGGAYEDSFEYEKAPDAAASLSLPKT